MISLKPSFKKLGIIGVPLLLFCLILPAPLFPLEDSPFEVIIAIGVGSPPSETQSPDSSVGPPSALDDAGKKAVLSYLYELLGPDQFVRLEDAVDTLILPEYRKYIEKAEIVSVLPLPGGDTAVVKAAVTVKAAALAAYLENIKKLDAKPEAPRTLSSAEKERLISKAQAIYIQAEVASDILLDRLRGIESFLSAVTLFETAGSMDGVYRCRMGIGRARASLGDVTAARTDFDRALDLARELKRSDYVADARIARARLMVATGDIFGARREIGTILGDQSLSGNEGLFGEALLIDAELDYRVREYESAGIKAGRAVTIFEGLADVKRLTQAQLLRGLILIAEGDGPGAVNAFKLAKTLADRLDDRISADKALIGMSRAYRIAGDPKTASLYLADALKTARDSGWIPGEIACLCETAYVHMALGDTAAADASATTAHNLALSRGDPMFTAASLFVVGEVARSHGDVEAAFDALLSCVRLSSDIRVVGRDIPYLFFGDTARDGALSGLLALSIELGREKKALAAVTGYEGSVIARELLNNPPVLAGPDAEPERLFRDAAGRAIAADDVSIGGDFLKTADTSRAEAKRLGDEAVRSLSDIETRIAREAPRLAALMGMKNPDPADLTSALREGSALVHYVINGAGAFAVVATGRVISVVKLDGGYDDISALTARIRDAAGPTGGALPGTDGEIPLAFTEPSTTLTSLLVTPLSGALSGITTIGISPAQNLPSLPIQALGRYNDEGRFIFLGEEYTLFSASWLLPCEAAAAPSGPGLSIMTSWSSGTGRSPMNRRSAAPAAIRRIPVTAPAASVAGGGGSLRVVRYLPDAPWGDARARLAVIGEKGVWGSSDFSRLEYLSPHDAHAGYGDTGRN